MKITLKTLGLVIFSILFITSCSDDECDLVCGQGEILTIDCQCETVDPCAGITCDPGEVLTADCDCIPGNNNTTETVTVSGSLTSNTNWTSDKIYELAGKVVVESGATLSVEAGTIIKGREGQGSLASALIIARGGKIEACGTADAPIILTSVLDNIDAGETAGSNLDESNSSLWGGLIVLGNAPCSFEGDVAELQIEGIPADDTFGLYGGNDPNDSSGSLCYVSVRHGGALIGEGNEINGITFGGVGAGTTVNHIEVVGNLDDGIEWFGGTVNCDNVVVWGADDDGLDIDQAYAGTINNAVVIAIDGTDHALEIDGPEGSYNAAFTLTNFTVKGFNDEMADFRKSARGTVTNGYFFNFPDPSTTDGEGDLEIDDDGGCSNYASGTLLIKDNVFNAPAGLTVADIVSAKGDNCDETGFDTQMTMDNSIGTSGGADTSVFGWSFTFQKGALNF
ncbi:MAG: hypothetical protein HKO89_00550 [Saprospiraceae bacterium]|nr:hypothetical protein [Bacteroidia bacterium]NNK89072.1 hypothetical protein [Saprospiraceae bacterium]